MESRWKIYLITNSLNDKKYVGQTVRTIQERWYQHINSAANQNDRLKFHVAIRLLGARNFKIQLLEEVDTQEEANVREIYWVSYYDSYKNGYNSTPGGATLTEISNEKPVYKVDLSRSSILRKYDSVNQAGSDNGLSPSSISYACKNFCTAGGFYWCYPDEFRKLITYETITCDGKRYIVKVDIDTFEVLDEYLGVDEASKATGMTATWISKLCNDQIYMTDVDFVMRWKVIWLKEREIVKTDKLLYKPFYVLMLDRHTLKILRVFKNSYVACEAFDVKRNTLEKHVDVPGSVWRDHLWCTKNNYKKYTDSVRR